MNRILTTMALLVLTTMTAWAEQKVNITVTPANGGTVTYAISNGVCTLTAKPADGYYITVDNLKAVATLDGGAVQTPQRRIEVVDGTELEVTPATGDDPSGETTYTLAMPADANLNVEVTAEFQSRTSIEGATVTVVVPEGGIIYNGEEQKPAIASVVLTTGATLTSADYAVSGYANNINVGNNAEVTVTGQGKYKGSATGTFTIGKADFSTVTIGSIADQTYTGTAITPTLTVKDGETTLTLDTDYMVSYSNNINAGTATATITGKGNYSGTASKTFTISKAKLPNFKVTLENWMYGDQPKQPQVEGNLGNGEVTFTYRGVHEGTFSETVPTNANQYEVKAVVAETVNYLSAEAINYFTINQAVPVIYYNKNEVETPINMTPEWPVLNNPKGVKVKYSSTNPSVATVDQDGKVTIVGIGETYIQAEVDDPNYEYVRVQYKLTVKAATYDLRINDVVVTEDNRGDLCGGTVKFDGKVRLWLTGANIQSIESGMDKLEIYLKGENKIRAGSNYNYAIQDLTNGKQELIIMTSPTEPGSLTLQNTKLKQVIYGFSKIELQSPLVDLNGAGLALNDVARRSAKIGASMDYLVNSSNTNATVDYGNDPGDVGTSSLVNTMIGNVLYTMNDTQTPGANDDGFYDGMIVLNSIMAAGDIQNLDQHIPGSEAYAKAFKGLTFMLPAGQCIIELICKTEPGHALCVKIGGEEPYVFSTNGVFQNVSVSYAKPTATYVRIYHVLTSSQNAPGNNHRIGPKATISTGIGGLSVSASSVDTPPGAQPDYRCLSMSDITMPEGGVGHIIVDNELVTDLDGDSFGGVFDDNNPSQRAYGNYDITYIDLRGTSITGKEFSRDEAPFNELPLSTFIYLPAGNFVSGPNMVVGSVCDSLLLGSKDYSFECASGGFAATHARFERSFAADKKLPIYLPFDVTEPEQYGTFFEYGGLTDGVVQMNKTKTVTADTPFYLKAKEGGVKVIEESAVNIQPMAGSEYLDFVGTYNPLVLYGDSYIYDNSLKKFRKAALDTVAPFEAYLTIDSREDALLTHWEGEPMPTAVDAVRNDSDETGQWYTLDGRMLQQQPTQKGVYLKNGKKHIVK